MWRKSLMTILTLALCGLLLGCGSGGADSSSAPPTIAPTSIQNTSAPPTAAPTSGANLPNPAAVYCQEQGYTSEIRTAADGSQSGVCILADGSECDEWAFFRGECGPAQPTAAPTGAAALWLDKATFAPEEEIQVHFVAPTPPLGGAWVGIIPSDVPHGDETINDENDLDYQYLEGQLAGVLTFVAPYRPGSYDFRLHDTDTDGQEVTSVTFVVTGGAVKPELWLDKTTFSPEEEIQVRFAVPDSFPEEGWVGIIPSDVPHGDETTNDEYDVAYEYLGGRVSGVLTFVAPDQPGSYDLRLHDTDENGQEVASVTFAVVGGAEKAELWLDKTIFAPGEEIQVHFAVPDAFPEAAWVGIIPSDVPHGDETTNDEYDLAYEYLGGRVSGALTFYAPDEPGSYDFRLHDTDDDGQEVASVTFEVKGE